MGNEKAIIHGKEKRKPYRKAKAACRGCRNHGTCEWCKDTRTYFDRKHRAAADDKLKHADEELD